MEQALHEAVLEEILEERVASSRGRRNPRGVKGKMSGFPLRRNQPISPPIQDIERTDCQSGVSRSLAFGGGVDA